MNIIINRNNPIIHLDRRGEYSVFCIMEREGYKHIYPLDIENFEQCEFIGIEFNNLFLKNNDVYKFLCWNGLYPYRGISIMKIGEIKSKRNG